MIKTSSGSSTQSRNWLTIFFALAALDAAAGLLYLLSIPSDPKNSLLMGFSAARLVLALTLLAAGAAAIVFALRARQPGGRLQALQRRLCTLPAFCIAFLVFLLLLAGFAASWLLTLPQGAAAIIERLRPLLLWALLVSAQTLLFQARFGDERVRYTLCVTEQAVSETEAAKAKPLPAWLLAGLLVVFLAGGVFTEGRLLRVKPIPQNLHYDFGFYTQALERALQGGDPYADHSLGSGFLYPTPSLFLVEFFNLFPDFTLRAAAYSLLNVVILLGMAAGVARLYGLPLRRVWWWAPLCLGFAPFLELLHAGQINLITSFAVFLMFMWEKRNPIASGLALSLGILSKVTPAAFLGYLAARRRPKTAFIALGFSGLLAVLAGWRYGWEAFFSYPSILHEISVKYPLGSNPQSLVSKLSTVGLVNFATVANTQNLLLIYLVVVCGAAALLAYVLQQREPLFIVLNLAMMLSPSVMWYHHYVFFLLPLLVWMAFSHLDRGVTLWCLGGMIVIQLDRWLLTNGLLVHLFGHVSMWLALAPQVGRLWGMLKETSGAATTPEA